MNFEDLFDKSNSIPRDKFRGKEFAAMAEPDDRKATNGVSVLTGLIVVALLSVIQGSLLWVIFELIEDFGVIDQRFPWSPFVGIAFAVNLIRVFDRSAFGSR